MTPFVLTFLLNALWQVPLLWVAGGIAARLLRRLSLAADYRVWVTTLVLQVVLPACSRSLFGRLLSHRETQAAAGSVTILQGPASAHAGLYLSPTLTTVVLVAFSCSLFFFSLQLLHGLQRTRRLRRTAYPFQLSPEAADTWNTCRHAFQLPATRLVESEEIRTPVTVGLRRPLILFPAGLVPSLASADWAALLAHESAHVARRDFSSNLALQIVTLPVAWHPVLHITLARLAESREIVCDRLAAEVLRPTHPLDGQLAFARSLLALASTLAHGPSAAAPHGIGFFDAHSLQRRIMSLTQPISRPSPLRRVATLAAAGLLALFTCTGAVALHTPLAAGDPVKVQGGVMAGHLLTRVTPRYPQAAKDAKVQGTVLLHALIGKDGTMQQLTVLSGPPELTPSALDAVRQWIYEPYLLNGEPTEVDTTITINYTLAS